MSGQWKGKGKEKNLKRRCEL
jgi:hypothetical protein